MIPGVVGGQIDDNEGGGGGGDGTAELDFVADTYTVNGVSLTLADVIDTPARRSASGLEILSTPNIHLIGDIATEIMGANWTIVIEFGNTAAFFDNYFLSVLDASEGREITLYATDFGSYFRMKFFENGLTGPSRFFAADPHATGTTKIGWTCTDSHSAGTLDGVAVNANSTDDTAIALSSWGSPPTKVRVADASGTGGISRGFIRKITLLPAQSDAALAALTA